MILSCSVSLFSTLFLSINFLHSFFPFLPRLLSSSSEVSSFWRPNFSSIFCSLVHMLSFIIFFFSLCISVFHWSIPSLRTPFFYFFSIILFFVRGSGCVVGLCRLVFLCFCFLCYFCSLCCRFLSCCSLCCCSLCSCSHVAVFYATVYAVVSYAAVSYTAILYAAALHVAVLYAAVLHTAVYYAAAPYVAVLRAAVPYVCASYAAVYYAVVPYFTVPHVAVIFVLLFLVLLFLMLLLVFTLLLLCCCCGCYHLNCCGDLNFSFFVVFLLFLCFEIVAFFFLAIF